MKSRRSSGATVPFGRAAAWVGALVLVVFAAVGCSGGGSDAPGDAGPASSSDDAVAPIDAPSSGDDSSLPDVQIAPPQGDDGSPEAAGPDANPPPTGGDVAPAPVLTAIAPAQATVGMGGPTIVCSGSGFVSRSVVQVDGVVLTTSFVSPTELRATIPTSSLTSVGTLQVTVGTAPPGGGGSDEIPFEVVNPSPTLTALSPTSALLGAADTTLTVTGTAFVSGATVSFDGAALATTVTGSTSATAIIPAASLLNSGTFPVTVTNPAPGGGTSSSIAFVVANPTVTVTKVTPSALLVGASDTQLALVGTGFVAASVVSFNGVPLATTYADAKHLGATVPGTSLGNAGSFPIVVTNPAPGGGVSTPVTLQVVYAAPTLASVSPTSAPVASPPPTVTVTGTGFLSGVTTLAFDGVSALTTVVDATHASAALTTQQMAQAYTFKLTATNPSPGGGTSSALVFNVANPNPVAISLNPSSTVVGAPDTTITVSGSAFTTSSTVLLGSLALSTTYVSATTLTAILPAANLASAGSLAIAVSTPAPGGGTSSPLAFQVNNPSPVATSVSPSFVIVGAPATAVTVSGSGFLPTSKVLLGSSALPTTYTSATSLGATIPASALAAAATLSLSVSNPAPGGGTSGALGFTVDNPGPGITQISPSSVIVPAADTPITLTGTGFVSASVVQIGGSPVPTTYGGSTLGATIPAANLATAATLSITVVNPAPGGGTSNVAFFDADDPAPVLSTVTPSTINAGASATSITLGGTGFVAASAVSVNGTNVAITAQTSTSITATVPAALLAAPSSLTVSVSNPAPGGGTSGSLTIMVGCNTASADVVLTALNTPQTLTLNFASAQTYQRITTTAVNDLCPSTAATSTTKEPVLGYVVVNAMNQAATLSAWAVCSTTDDGFLAFYSTSTVPSTQSQLEACTGYVAEGLDGAGAHNSPEANGDLYCPGLLKSRNEGLSIPACGRAVVVVQPYSTTDKTYTVPTTLKVELQ